MDHDWRCVTGVVAVVASLVLGSAAGLARSDPAAPSPGKRFELAARLRVDHTWGSVAAGEHPTLVRAGPTLEVRDDWGLRRAACLSGGLTWYRNGSRRAGFSYERGRHEGDVVFSRGFAYDDDTFTAGERAVTTLRLEVIEVRYERRLRSAWIGAGLRYTTVEAGIVTSTLNPPGEREHVGALSPVVCLEAAGAVAKTVDLVGEARAGLFGLPVALWEPAGIRFAEVAGGVRWRPHARWTLVLGVEARAIHMRYAGREADRVSFGDNRVDLRMLGPVVKVGARV